MNAFIIKSGIAFAHEEFVRVLGARMKDVYSKFIVKSVMHTPRQKITKIVNLHQIQSINGKSHICFAKYSGIQKYLAELGIPITYHDRVKSGDAIELNSALELEDCQVAIRNHLTTRYYQVESGLPDSAKTGIQPRDCILVMPTGSGKSFIAMSIIEHLKLRTVIAIPNTSNLVDWRNYLKDSFPDTVIGEYHSKKRKFGDIIIITIQSLLSEFFAFDGMERMNRFDFFNRIGLMIYDEIHSYASDKRSEIFWRASVKYTLALTATPDERLDGMDELYYKFLGPLEYANRIANLSIATYNVRVRILEHKCAPEFRRYIPGSEGYNYVETLKLISSDPARVDLAMSVIRECVDAGICMFVFVKLIENLHMLYDAAKAIIPESKLGKMHGDATDAEIAHARDRAQIIFIGIDYGKQGLSINRVSAILLWDSIRHRVRQMLGRMLRRGNNNTRYMFDIVDMHSPVSKQFAARRKVYAERKYDIRVATGAFVD